MPDYPVNLHHSGEYNQVPEIIGCTEDEGSLFLLGIYTCFRPDLFLKMMKYLLLQSCVKEGKTLEHPCLTIHNEYLLQSGSYI